MPADELTVFGPAMKAIMRRLMAGLLLLAVAAGPPQVGIRFLLLESRQLVEGEIEQVGDSFKVKRDGGETLIPVDRVMAICIDKAGAFRVLSEKIDPKNAEQRLKLAEWCHNNGLTKEAVAEARAAVELRPNSPIATRLMQYYEQSAVTRKPAFQPEKPANAEPAALPETVDCSPEALRHYCTRVQPVLMNACSGCHATTAKFRLERVYSDTTNPRAQTFQNLAAAMAQIDRAKPSASPLLQKALTAHGSRDDSAAARSRDAGLSDTWSSSLECWRRAMRPRRSRRPPRRSRATASQPSPRRSRKKSQPGRRIRLTQSSSTRSIILISSKTRRYTLANFSNTIISA